MVEQAPVVICSNRVGLGARLNPSRTVSVAVVPNPIKVVINHVLIHNSVGTGLANVIPPNLVISLVCPRKYLISLIVINIVKDILT